MMINCHVYIFSDVVGLIKRGSGTGCFVVLAGDVTFCGMGSRSRSV